MSRGFLYNILKGRCYGQPGRVPPAAGDRNQTSENRLLVKFRTFRIQTWLVEVISGSFCMVLRGEAQKTTVLRQKTKNQTPTNWKLDQQILNPKHAKFVQKSEIGHVRTCQDLSRRTSTYCKPADIFSIITPFLFLLPNLSYLQNHLFH